ncbi:MAG: hypothetical protein KJ666_12360 [Bacteroidetes bacterium]|nr:hypothetical protein [Bacteroidota bacterium]MBU2584034.1 hypothetical protein [Bacteroidota bacterium]
MENRVVELSKYRIDKAQKDLESAEILLDKKLYTQRIQFDNAKSFLLRIKNYIEINRLIQ